MSKSSSLYRFERAGERIVAVFEAEKGRVKAETIQPHESYRFDGTDVIKTEQKAWGVELTRYSDPDGDGWYAKASKTTLPAPSTATTTPLPTPPASPASAWNATRDETYRFDIQDQRVVAVYEIKNGTLKPKALDPQASYTLSGNQILKTETSRFGQELTTYLDADGDGLYVKVSEQWLANGTVPTVAGATTATALASASPATSGTAPLPVLDGQLVRGSEGADDFLLRGSGSMAIAGADFSHGDRLIFDTGLGLNSVADLLRRAQSLQADGRDLYIRLEGLQLTLLGVNLQGLSTDDLVFVS